MSNGEHSRREWLTALGSAGLLGLAGCSSARDDDDGAFRTGTGTATDATGTGTTAGDGTTDDGTTTEDSSAAETVPVAVLAPTSGGLGDLGTSQLRGAELAVERVNESDAYGFGIELATADTEAHPNRARAELEQIAGEQGVDFAVGGITAPVSLALSEVAWEFEQVYFSGSQTATITGSSCNPGTFRCETSTARMAGALSSFVAADLGSNVWFHYADYAYGNDVYEMVREALASTDDAFAEAGNSTSEIGTTDFSTVIERIGQSDAETVVLGLPPSDLVTFLAQADARGLSDEVALASPSGGSRAVRRGAGESAVGTYGGVRYHPSLETGDNRAFVDAYASRHGERPDNFARVGFDSVRLVAKGIRAAGSTDPGDVRDALKGDTFTTVLGDVIISPENRQAINPAWVGELTAGSEYPDVELQHEVGADELLLPGSELARQCGDR
ncbi:ABC transporter substrate-binding protein [Halostella salina]|uniref:ABC transporter substrate-binding protein n=1 Tax=Halostella salina TaxID=1547897 RepID=UPI000EF7EA29|nr:ABC transporter substrate-binding protein [Halostella salina]